MKSATLGLCVLIVMCAGSTVKAQCGCGGGYRPAPVVSYAPPVAPLPRPSMSPSRIAYVNKLATPVPRANYTLNYAVHLTDGRILLSDFLPPGQTVRGIENQTGTGGRRMSTTSMSTGAISVVDPSTNNTIATFTPNM